MMSWDRYDYRINGCFLSALINGDYSGLNDDEEKQFNRWELDARQNARNSGFTVGHWSCENEESEDFGFCDVTGLFSSIAQASLMVYREKSCE